MKTFVISLLGLVLAACTAPAASGDGGDAPTPSEGYQKITFADSIATPAERDTCEAAGGKIQKAGMLGYEHCIQPLPDAGQICTDASDCLGRCVAPGVNMTKEPDAPDTGICEATDNPFGCIGLVNNGQFEGTICVD